MLVLFMLSSVNVLASDFNSDTIKVDKLSLDSNYWNYEYVIDHYDINVVVNEDNTLNIKEKIGAYFFVQKHGILRSIPITNKVYHEDGTTSNVRAKITDVSVDAPYSSSVSSGKKQIKIGDTDETLTGAKEYNISYLYNLGKDTGKDYDELYVNLIGNEWDAPIGDITFTIDMPKDFDVKKLGFSSGDKGSTDSSNITYKVVGNVITGNYDGTLEANQSLTVRLELPEGYFIVPSSGLDVWVILSIILPILFVLITVIMWFKFGKDNMVVETVEFYPPEGCNSAEVGFLYKGKADKNDAISLLIYLANKGYLEISDTENKTIFSKTKSFKITKLKNYDGTNKNEKLFLKGLFKNDKVSSVTAKDLKDKFYSTLDKIINDLNKKVNRQKVFEKSSFGKGIFIILMIAIAYILITIKPLSEYGDMAYMPIILVFSSVGLSVLLGTFFGNAPLPAKIFGVVWGILFGLMPWVAIVLPSLLIDPMYLFIYMLGIVCIMIMVVLLKVMPKRTVFGNEMLGKIKGFKTFLETAEKPKLEALVMENPEYFYNILPYTYVLGISDKWIKKFEVIAIEAPSWYDGSTSFNMAGFGTFMNSTMSSASTAMSSSPSSGGGGSGGGSSGGGSGGGGGGSW